MFHVDVDLPWHNPSKNHLFHKSKPGISGPVGVFFLKTPCDPPTPSYRVGVSMMSQRNSSRPPGTKHDLTENGGILTYLPEKGPFQKELNTLKTIDFQGRTVSFRKGI